MTEDTADQAAEDLTQVDDAVDQATDETPQLDDDGNPIEDQALLDDEQEEVEHDGQKYKVPKAVKPLLMMQADYTKKTQEVAERGRALDARETEIAQQAVAQQELLKEHARVVAIEDQVEAYQKVDWASLRAQDRDAYDEHWDRYQQLKDTLGKAKDAVSKKDEERALEQQRARAKLVEDAAAVLKRDIPEWSPELAGKLTDFGETRLGLTRAELAQITDPRLIKTLHLAYVGEQTVKAQEKAKKLTEAQNVRPAANPASGARPAPPTGLDDRLTTDEWMRRRNAQLKKRA